MRKMKNIISISVVILSTTVFLSAVKASDNDHQKKPAITGLSLSSVGNPDLRIFELGFHYMPTFYTMDFRTSDGGIVQGSVSLSHGFGAMMAVNLSQHIGFQSEIDYYKASQSYKDLDVDQNVDIKYIDIPVLLSLNTNKTARVNLNADKTSSDTYNVMVCAKRKNNAVYLRLTFLF